MFDFFVSHASADKKGIVDELVDILENMGYSVWYDKNELAAGDFILNDIEVGLRKSYCLLLVLTDNFAKSNWVSYETGYFAAFQNGRIVPLLYQLSPKNKETIMGLLGNRKYIDVGHLSKEQVASACIRALSKARKENRDLVTTENLDNLQKKLASYETINSDLISVKLKEYLALINSQSEYAILSAKKIVRDIVCDLLGRRLSRFDSEGIKNSGLCVLIESNDIGSINTREYISFILSMDSEEKLEKYLPIINRALENILVYYIHTKYPIKPDASKIDVVLQGDFEYKDFMDMFEIDRKVLREDLIASADTSYSWYKYNNLTHIAVRDTVSQKIVGYFSVLPITDDVYQKILQGEFKDKDFTTDSIQQYIFPDFYRLYIAAVAIEPEYQNTGAFVKLYNALIDMLLALAKEREIYISEIVAEASTKQGEKFCKMVGMKKIAQTTSETDVYSLVMIPPEFRLHNKKGRELFHLCEQKFKEYRDYFEMS